MLVDADLVKFAGIVPDAATARDSLSDARALLTPLWTAAERRRIAAEAAAAASHSALDDPASAADSPVVPVAEPSDADDEAAA